MRHESGPRIDQLCELQSSPNSPGQLTFCKEGNHFLGTDSGASSCSELSPSPGLHTLGLCYTHFTEVDMEPGELSGMPVVMQPGQHGSGPEVLGSLSSVTLNTILMMPSALWKRGQGEVLSRNSIYEPKVTAVNTLFPNSRLVPRGRSEGLCPNSIGTTDYWNRDGPWVYLIQTKCLNKRGCVTFLG